MASKAVRDALWGKLNSDWTDTRLIDFENGQDRFSGVDPWVSLQFSVSEESQIAIRSDGNREWRETGAFSILVGVPARTGWEQAMTYADGVRSLLRGKQLLANLVIRGIGPPTQMSSSELVVGSWFILIATGDYQYDFFN